MVILRFVCIAKILICCAELMIVSNSRGKIVAKYLTTSVEITTEQLEKNLKINNCTNVSSGVSILTILLELIRDFKSGNLKNTWYIYGAYPNSTG